MILKKTQNTIKRFKKLLDEIAERMPVVDTTVDYKNIKGLAGALNPSKRDRMKDSAEFIDLEERVVGLRETRNLTLKQKERRSKRTTGGRHCDYKDLKNGPKKI